MSARKTTAKRLDDVGALALRSIVRNCRSYIARHDDYYDQRFYVQNLAGLHRIDAAELWLEVQR